MFAGWTCASYGCICVCFNHWLGSLVDHGCTGMCMVMKFSPFWRSLFPWRRSLHPLLFLPWPAIASWRPVNSRRCVLQLTYLKNFFSFWRKPPSSINFFHYHVPFMSPTLCIHTSYLYPLILNTGTCVFTSLLTSLYSHVSMFVCMSLSCSLIQTLHVLLAGPPTPLCPSWPLTDCWPG